MLIIRGHDTSACSQLSIHLLESIKHRVCEAFAQRLQGFEHHTKKPLVPGPPSLRPIPSENDGLHSYPSCITAATMGIEYSGRPVNM